MAGCAGLAAHAADEAIAAPPTVAEATPVLGTVEVLDSTAAQRRFDSAASHSSVAVDGFSAPMPLVHLSELLSGQAGVVTQDRGNYAQDLQIAVRGFGTRATFGVRGVRILVDGIPATMPDGQGQAATAHLPSAAQVDVLRGPLAQLYGNAAGGVVQVTTREPRTAGTAQAGVAVGSFGQRLVDASLDFGDQRLGGLVDLSHFEIDGWRAHSAAQRTHFNGKLVARPDARTRITALVNVYDQPLAQDPLGLTRTQMRDDPRQAAAVATAFDTRKSVAQHQLGVVVDHQLSSADSVQLRAYGGARELKQYLSFSGAAANSAGGVVELDRSYRGVGATWTRSVRLASGLPVTWTAGLETHRMAELRQGFVNEAGDSGALRRNEDDRATNTDVYGQLDAWLSPRWRAIAGVRTSQVRVRVDDRYVTPANPDDSGSRTWRHTSPVLGVVWAATDALNLYANAGRGFETPTLAEMAYSTGNAGPNYALSASRSRQWEVGAKWRGERQQIDLAWFDTRSRGEIVPVETVNGRSVFQNVDNVRRRGLELAWRAAWGAWSPSASYTYLDAHFGNAYTGAAGAAIAAGNQLPGTARHVAHWAVDYAPSSQWRVGGAVNLSGRVFANDTNSESAAGFAVVGLHAGYQLRGTTPGAARWQLWARLDNLFNRHYAGTLIVNDGNGRFFEPAAGRRLMVGVRAQFL
ncbi:ligand-gated channel protein [Acidovorax sp. Leaf76]|uniref:TonB-dependent receptor family protein n=1 Tax=unclassified Acidovorax TaxID=2684926 RepID=UPI000701119A|nr:ligand-gated channel protein [Acidovorax sp. Leaf76]KQO32226.1 ligand-gated channel protein [Acidovorax sp. Leaf84]KQS31786.1 ligand-gated channel protein [Acidovorax sp. Leaf191]